MAWAMVWYVLNQLLARRFCFGFVGLRLLLQCHNLIFQALDLDA